MYQRQNFSSRPPAAKQSPLGEKAMQDMQSLRVKVPNSPQLDINLIKILQESFKTSQDNPFQIWLNCLLTTNSFVFQNVFDASLSYIVIKTWMSCVKAMLLIAFIVALAQTALVECPNPEMLVSFHPHMDIFWLNSHQQLTDINFQPEGFLYMMNQRNSKTIYNSMLQALEPNSTRKYFTTEVFFFKDWYQYISAENKEKVKTLLKEGRLEIANSGWVENDEALPYYDDIIGQYSMGMNYMYENFNYISKIGWATDCFGHSHSQAALLNELGFEMQGIERMDQRYIHQRNGGPLLELFWKTKSDSNNLTYGGLMTHIRHFLHEVNDFRSTTVQRTVQDFQRISQAMQTIYEKKILFRFLGNDFEEFITKEFVHLEMAFAKLNASISDCGGYKYGNPTDYMTKVKEYWKKHPVKTREFDFIPDWDQDRYWTGYYTTDPLSKKACRDSSRILHFYKKALLHLYGNKNITEFGSKISTVEVAQNVVAMMQHHDGITATSKSWIMKEMRGQLSDGNTKLMKSFKELNEITHKQCNLAENDNTCEIDIDSNFTLNLYHYGTPKNQRIEVIFPVGKKFKPDNIPTTSYDIFCGLEKCQVIMMVPLTSGVTQVAFSKILIDEARFTVDTTNSSSSKSLKWGISDNSFKYTLDEANNKYIQISYHETPGIRAQRSTVSWDKYNQKTNKGDGPTTGIYIMVNTGVLTKLFDITSMKTFTGGRFIKVYLTFNNQALSSEITIDLTQPDQIDVNTKFRAPVNEVKDYFIKISSKIDNPQKEFYHDANGYLVMKRKVDWKPDYQHAVIAQDRINGNTYPMAAFAYIKDQNNKLVVFTDRAQGVSIYEPNEIIINFDRLTLEDGKGVGEMYRTVVDHNLKHRIGLVGSRNDVERVWQKEFDEAVVGTYGTTTGFVKPLTDIKLSNTLKYLKYSIFYSNKHALVFRVQNLAEFQTQKVKLFNGSKLNSDVLNLALESVDWKESFLNGFPLTKTHSWIEIPQSDVDIHKNKMIDGDVELKPLQIRSFRIDFLQKISNALFYPADVPTNIEDLDQLTPKPSQVSRMPRLSRCF